MKYSFYNENTLETKTKQFEKATNPTATRNNYFIGPNFENAVGFFVGGEKSLFCPILGQN